MLVQNQISLPTCKSSQVWARKPNITTPLDNLHQLYGTTNRSRSDICC